MPESDNNKRREFIKGAALAGAALAVGGLLPESAVAAAPTVDPDLDGVIEMHVHADPDVRARCTDQLTLTSQCRLNGYRAVMYKCHDFITHDNAYILSAAVPGIEVFGGITLNRNYGDKVNVQAAQMATQVSGGRCRCIWMPTYQSAYDLAKKGERGVPVLDSSGRVLPEVVKVMEICARENIIFATGHSAPEEAVVLARQAEKVGVKKCVITHGTQEPWKLSLDQAKQCLEAGAHIEHCVLAYYKGERAALPHYKAQAGMSMREFAEYIALAPRQQFISTDLGQAGNVTPVDGLRAFIKGLRKAGVSEKNLDLLSRRVPAYLLGLEEKAPR